MPPEHAGAAVTVRYWAGARAAAGVDSDTVTGCRTVARRGRRGQPAAPRPGAGDRRELTPARRPPRQPGRSPGGRGPCWRCCHPSLVGDGRMPAVSDVPDRPEAAAAAPLTRAQRRAAAPRTVRARVRRQPLVVASVVALSGLIALTGFSHPFLVALAVALAGLVVAWGWAALLGLPSPRGTSAVLAVGRGRLRRRRGPDHRRPLPRVDPRRLWPSRSSAPSCTSCCDATAGRG